MRSNDVAGLNFRNLGTVTCLSLFIPVIFNSCQGGFEARGVSMLDSSSLCRAPLKQDLLNKFSLEKSPYLSPFSKGKLFGRSLQSIEEVAFKLGSHSELLQKNQRLALSIDNSCLTTTLYEGRDYFSSINFGHSTISDELRVQTYSYTVPEEVSYHNFSRLVEEDPCIIGVGKSRTYSTSSLSDTYNDPDIYLQGHLANIKADSTYNEIFSTTWGIPSHSFHKVKVAIIDTGVYYNHPDLKPQMYHPNGNPNLWGVDATTLGNESTNYGPSDIAPNGHGTHVAGLVGALANNKYGVAGLMPHGIELMAIKVFTKDTQDFDGDGDSEEILASTEAVVKGIEWAIEHEVDVINLSLSRNEVIQSATDLDDPIYEAALIRALNAGIAVVIAAGNGEDNIGRKLDESKFMTFPAYFGHKYPGIITVGALDAQTGFRSSFSNFSDKYVEIFAPGSHSGEGGIVSTGSSPLIRTNKLNGTSQAAPLISATIAITIGLIETNYQGQKPSPAELERLVVEGANTSSLLFSDAVKGRKLDMSTVLSSIQKSYPATASPQISDRLPGCI